MSPVWDTLWMTPLEEILEKKKKTLGWTTRQKEYPKYHCLLALNAILGLYGSIHLSPLSFYWPYTRPCPYLFSQATWTPRPRSSNTCPHLLFPLILEIRVIWRVFLFLPFNFFLTALVLSSGMRIEKLWGIIIEDINKVLATQLYVRAKSDIINLTMYVKNKK